MQARRELHGYEPKFADESPSDLALAATSGNVTAAAKKLGISRRTLHRKINEMNLAKAHAKITEPSGSKE